MGYFFSHFDRVSKLFMEHLYLVMLSLFIALCIAIPIALIINRFKKAHSPVTGILGIFYTIPSLALFALMIPFSGLGSKSAVIALVGYSQMSFGKKYRYGYSWD